MGGHLRLPDGCELTDQTIAVFVFGVVGGVRVSTDVVLQKG